MNEANACKMICRESHSFRCDAALTVPYSLRNDEHSCTTENGAPAAVSQRMDREQRSEAKGPFSLAPFQSQSGFSLEVEEVSEIVDGEAAFIRSGCR